MPSTRFGPRPQCHCHCHRCGNNMPPDLGNLCPACREPETQASWAIGCALVAAAFSVALSVWFFNI